MVGDNALTTIDFLFCSAHSVKIYRKDIYTGELIFSVSTENILLRHLNIEQEVQVCQRCLLAFMRQENDRREKPENLVFLDFKKHLFHWINQYC